MSFLSFFVKSLIENVFLKNLRINIKVYTFAKFLGIYKQEHHKVKTRILFL